jgi:hypothetical protein
MSGALTNDPAPNGHDLARSAGLVCPRSANDRVRSMNFAVARKSVNSMCRLRPPALGLCSDDLHAGSAGRTYLSLMLAVALLIASVTAAAAKIACKTNYQGDGTTQWAWRMIDGRTCWYQGRRKIDKELLYWPKIEPALSKTIVESVQAQDPDPDQTVFSPADQILLESYWPDLSNLPQLFPIDRWWPDDRLAAMLDFARPFEPPGATRVQLNEGFVLAGALIVVCGIWLALEVWRTTGARPRA